MRLLPQVDFFFSLIGPHRSMAFTPCAETPYCAKPPYRVTHGATAPSDAFNLDWISLANGINGGKPPRVGEGVKKKKRLAKPFSYMAGGLRE